MIRRPRAAAWLAVALATGCAGGTRVTPEDAARAVAELITDVPVRNYATCQLRAALWGGFKATVQVDGSVTADQKPRTFLIDKGRLLVEVPAHGPGQPVEVRRWGHVTFASAEEAFAKGAAFYIDGVTLRPPDVVAYTVHSNPQVAIDRAAARLELRRVAEGGGYLTNAEIIETPKPLRSAPGAQAREWKGGRWDDPARTTLLSIVRGTPMTERCLLSNEIRLESVAGVASR
jgi:hypothetical protein